MGVFLGDHTITFVYEMTATLILDPRSSFDMNAAIGQLSPVLADLSVPDVTVTAAGTGIFN